MTKGFLNYEATRITIDPIKDPTGYHNRIKFAAYVHSKRGRRNLDPDKKDIRLRYLDEKYLIKYFTKNGKSLLLMYVVCLFVVVLFVKIRPSLVNL